MKEKDIATIREQLAPGENTLATHAAEQLPPGISPAAPPIYQSSVFLFTELEAVDDVFAGRSQGYSYSRVSNPNVDQLAEVVARLEGAPAGMAAASGMAAIHAALRACLTAGKRRVVAADDIYGGTYSLLEEIVRPEGLGGVPGR